MLTIQQVGHEDKSAVIDLIHTTIRTCYPTIYPPKVVQFFLEYHSPKEVERRLKGGTLLVLKLGDEICGTGFLYEEELGGVYVHPDHQRKGYGYKIVRELLQLAQKQKLKRVWLDATPIAKPLYDKLGFILVSELTQWIGDERLDYFKMEKYI
jgi:GNAT superfamily N-acetyltransferase